MNKSKAKASFTSPMPKLEREEARSLPKCWLSFAIENTTNAAIKWYLSLQNVAYQQAFVVHLAGLHVSFYWARFPSQYLDTIRNHNLSKLTNIPKVTLHHSQPRSLIDPRERDLFLHEFVAVICYVAGGYGNVGFFRRDVDTPIHRDVDEKVSDEPCTP